MAKLSELIVSLLIIGTVTKAQSFTGTQSFAHLIFKAREVEPQVIIGAINMLQQPVFIEKQRFASSLEELELGIRSETENYEYKVFAYSQTQAQVIAQAKQRGLKSYTGAVFVVKDDPQGDSITVAVCETDRASQTPPAMPQSSGHEIKCPFGSKQVGW